MGEPGNQDYPDSWKPEPGDILAGKLVRISARDAGHGPYPIIEVEDRDGERLAFHGFHTVFRSEFEDQDPSVGDLIAVRYEGVPDGKRYHAYTVKVKRADNGDTPW